MSVPFDQAVDQLAAMFPSYDRAVLTELLALNGHHIERTIETVLAMEGQVDLPSSTIAAQQPRGPAPGPAARPTNPPAVVNHRHEGGYDPRPGYGSDAYNSSFGGPSEPLPQPPQVTQPQQQSSGSGYGNVRAAYRGTRCQLPSDFLRVPYSAEPAIDETILADEQLAMMLQNELFQHEAFRALGDDYTGPRPAGGTGAASSAQAGGDLGILKGLASMGAAAKRRLSQLALKYKTTSGSSDVVSSEPYSATTTSALHSGTRDLDGDTEMSSLLSPPRAGSGSASKSGVRGADGNGLLGAGDEDEDEDEVINFSSGDHTSRRGSHSLDSPYRPK